MQAVISPGRLSGSIRVPASKSMSQRALAAALLHHGKTVIRNIGNSADEKAALGIIQQLGARINFIGDTTIEVTSEGVYPSATEIYCDESGLAARLFIPIAALSNKAIAVTGNGSLLDRPFGVYTRVLPQLNVTVQHTAEKLPFKVQGPLTPAAIEIDGSLSSQFLSGLLFAFCYAAKERVSITVHDLASKPYIDLTIEMLARFGHRVLADGYSRFTIDPGSFEDVHEVSIDIEGDWSSASALMAGAALTGEVSFEGLNTASQQADREILEALRECGASVVIEDEKITIGKGQLRGFDFDATHCPDLFPALAVLASFSKGASHIKGIHRLLHKESNRIESICDMLEAFGIFHAVEGDNLYIEGQQTIESATVFSYNDHRIAMAAAAAALRAYDNVRINHAEAVRKSYPDFFTDLQQLGAHCRLNYQA
jgi:3-phosphoshikimate 1-carboxyvinyltransferase